MGRICIKMDLQEFRWGMDSLDLAENRDRWRSLVSAVTDCRFYIMWGNCSLSEGQLASQEGIFSMEIASQSVSYLLS